MRAFSFDTHLFVKRLTSSGMPEVQAEALSEVLAERRKESLGQNMESALVTKAALAKDTGVVTERLAILERRILVLKWMAGLIIAGVVSLVTKAFCVG